MNLDQLIKVAFLAMSCLSLAVQSVTLRVLRRAPLAADSLIRTAWCRVGCAVLYVYVGVNALLWQWNTLTTTFLVFFMVQVTWQVNAGLDIVAGRNGQRADPRHSAATRTGSNLVLALVMAVVVTIGAYALSAQSRTVGRYSYDRCQERVINVARANQFSQAMAVLEASNTAIDPTLRASRIRLYRGQILAPPHCGSRP